MRDAMAAVAASPARQQSVRSKKRTFSFFYILGIIIPTDGVETTSQILVLAKHVGVTTFDQPKIRIHVRQERGFDKNFDKNLVPEK